MCPSIYRPPVKKNFICPDFPQPTRARVAPGPNPGRRFTVRLAVTLPPLIYGAGGSCGIGTPPIRCTHSHHREMDILPCTSPPALLAGPRSAGLRYNFSPECLDAGPGPCARHWSGSAWTRASTLICVGTLGCVSSYVVGHVLIRAASVGVGACPRRGLRCLASRSLCRLAAGLEL